MNAGFISPRGAMWSLCAALLFSTFGSAVAGESCPAGTFWIGEDEDYLYCQRENDALGDDAATRARVLKVAMSKLGYPYHQVGGRCLDGDVAACPTDEHPHGCYDCSALVYDVLRSIGQPVRPTAANQYEYFASIPGGLTHEPIFGDIVFFAGPNGGIAHTGIYVGSRDGAFYYLHAPGAGRPVQVGRTTRQPFAFGSISRLRVSRPRAVQE